MHITVAGNGPDLVLLHGWGMNAVVWGGLAPELTPQFRVHSVDVPGHGLSPACVQYTLDAIAGALASAAPPRVTVCGWSLGGQLALRWALLNPSQVERIILIAGTPRFVRCPGWESGMQPAAFDAFAQDVVHDPHGAVQRFLALQAHGDTQAREVIRRLRACVSARDAGDVAALAAGLQILKNTDLRGEVAKIAQPVLLMHGDRDGIVPTAAAEFLRRSLPRAALQLIAGAAHAPFIGRPHDVAQSIAEFCRG
jgi:pimeloyl-[acyl-carrier protein] methyl ester esterase